MKPVEERNHNAAAVVYINACLKGRGNRIYQKREQINKHELVCLNTPVYENGNEEILTLIRDENSFFESHVDDKLVLQQAMQHLTLKEARIITEVFWQDKQISQISSELKISRNSIHKMKKRAIEKLRKAIF